MQGLHVKKLSILIAIIGCVACAPSPNADYEALKTRKLVCPDSAMGEYSAWGPNGMQEVCSIKHGPFTAAEGGRVVIEGAYQMGKPSGTWKWYDKSGQVQKTQTY